MVHANEKDLISRSLAVWRRLYLQAAADFAAGIGAASATPEEAVADLEGQRIMKMPKTRG